MRSLPRRVAGRLARPVSVPLRRRRLRPVLSVVVPVYDVAAWLPETLDSLLGQSLHELEVIAVDDSSPDDSLAVLRRRAARDPRLRVLTQPNAGQGAARNRGVELARGEFLTFVDSDDTLPPDALEHMVATLRASDSDFCVGGVRRMRRSGFVPLAWARTAHSRDRIGTTVEQTPGAMQDIIACNRVFRTAFWRERIGGFAARTAYEDHVPMLAAYVRAERFDVLAEPTYNWRIREDRTSTGQQKATLGNLADRVRVKRDAEKLLDAEASPRVREIWVGRTLEVDFPPFLKHALVGDADYRDLLAATLRRYLDQARQPGPGALALVSSRQKIRCSLAAAQRWDDLAAAEEWFDDIGLVPPATVEDGTVVAVLPDRPFLRDLPAHVRALSSLECHHQAVLDHVWSPSPGRLRLEGWAVLRGLGVPGTADVTAWLEGPDGDRVEVAVESVRRVEADLWGRQQWASYAGGGFVATVDLHALAPGAWHLVVRTAYAGVAAQGPVLEALPRSGAARGWSARAGCARGTYAVGTRWDAADGFTLDVTAPTEAPADEPGTGDVASVELDGDTVRLGLPHGVDTVDVSGPGSELRVAVEDGVAAYAVPRARGRHRLRTEGRELRADTALEGRLPLHLVGEAVAVEVAVERDGTLLLSVLPPVPPADRGASGRRRLLESQRAAALADGPLDDAVVLRGGAAVREVDRVLAAERPRTARWWSVPDLSLDLPTGALALVEGTREWYDALARCRWLVTDTELAVPAPWRGPHQRRVRLAGPDGAPSWRSEALAPDVVRRRQRETREQTDVLAVPDEATAQTYRVELGFEGPVWLATDPTEVVARMEL